MLYKNQTGQPLTLQDRIVGVARQKLVNKAKAKPKTLGSLWDEYAKSRSHRDPRGALDGSGMHIDYPEQGGTSVGTRARGLSSCIPSYCLNVC